MRFLSGLRGSITDIGLATNEHLVANPRNMEKEDRPIDAVQRPIAQDMHFSIHYTANHYGIIPTILSNSLH